MLLCRATLWEPGWEELPPPEPSFMPRDPARRSARGEDERREELARWRRLLLWSAGLTLPVFLTAMVLPLLPACRPLLKAQVRRARRAPPSACPKAPAGGVTVAG